MRPLIVRQLDYDLTPVAGLALVGHMLAATRPVLSRIDAALPLKGGVANSDIIRSYLGLRTQGKSDFEAVENFRGDAFFKPALDIGLLPSSPTLRQRMDTRAVELFEFLPPMIETLLASQRPDWGVLPCGWLPLDVDTFWGGQQRNSQGRRGTHLRRRGRLLPAGRLPRQPRLLPGAGLAPGRSALGPGDRLQP